MKFILTDSSSLRFNTTSPEIPMYEKLGFKFAPSGTDGIVEAEERGVEIEISSLKKLIALVHDVKGIASNGIIIQPTTPPTLEIYSYYRE